MSVWSISKEKENDPNRFQRNSRTLRHQAPLPPKIYLEPKTFVSVYPISSFSLPNDRDSKKLTRLEQESFVDCRHRALIWSQVLDLFSQRSQPSNRNRSSQRSLVSFFRDRSDCNDRGDRSNHMETSY